MSCLPVPGISRCHLLSSAAAFSVRLAASRPGSPDIGVVCRPVYRGSHLDPGARKAGRARSRLLEEEDRRPAKALAASSLLRRRDPGTGVSVVALEARLDPPPTQGCANGITQSPGGCPAGKAVWPRLIITPGKLRGAM